MLTRDLSLRWGHAPDSVLAPSGLLGLSGGAWTLPTDLALVVPPLAQMRLVVNLAPLRRHAFWGDGRQRRAAASPVGALRIAPSGETGRAEIDGDRFRFAQIYIPHGAMLSAGLGSARAFESAAFADPNFDQTDPLVSALVQALVGAPPPAAPALYGDHLSLALLSHLVARYGVKQTLPQRSGLLDARRARRAAEMLHRAIEVDLSLEALAADAGMSPFHFARSFTRTFGMPPFAYLRLLRMDRAKSLLGGTTRSITEIALDCGYATPSAFAAAFRKHTQMTPAQWRASATI